MAVLGIDVLGYSIFHCYTVEGKPSKLYTA